MPGDDYQPGDSIIGQWRTSRAIDSPTIRLCVADEDHITAAEKNCGSAVHPDVQQSGQTYRVSL